LSGRPDGARPRLVLVESNTSGTGRLFVRRAAEMGLHPVLLAARPERWDALAAEGAEVRGADTAAPGALLDACRAVAAEAPIDGVWSSSEYFVAAAAALARALGLPGPSARAIRACRDKERQRVVLAAAGVGIPRFAAAATVREALDAAADIGYPVVLKPVDGSGSVGVRLCATADEARAHAALLLGAAGNERGLPVRAALLVEELAVGPEFSVELFDGKALALTGKHVSAPPWFVETGHDVPAAVPLTDADVLRRAAEEAARALGLGWGPVHAELRLTAAGPRIIEVNPRLAGGFIPELVRLATGVDLIRATLQACTGAAPEVRQTAAGAASIRFVIPPADGVLEGSTGLDRASADPAVAEARLYVQPGAEVRRAGDFRDRVGHVIASGATTARAAAAAGRALSTVHLRVRTPETAEAA
jgi:biotin carboxylase